MATWKGWDTELVKALGVKDTHQVGNLLTTWAHQVAQTCDNNPLVASRHATGSANCRRLANGKRAQNYKSHASAITATAAQLTSGDYPHLWAAIQSGAPYQVSDTQKVADDLKKWGAAAAGEAYQIEVQQGGYGTGGGTGPPPKLKAAQALRGWADMQKSVNHHMPAALKASSHARAGAWRNLRRAGKVLR